MQGRTILSIDLPYGNTFHDDELGCDQFIPLRLREKPLVDAKAVTTLWRGSVLEIVSLWSETKYLVDGELDFWYQINYDGRYGWVFGAYLDLFDSRKKAENASRALKK